MALLSNESLGASLLNVHVDFVPSLNGNICSGRGDFGCKSGAGDLISSDGDTLGGSWLGFLNSIDITGDVAADVPDSDEVTTL